MISFVNREKFNDDSVDKQIIITGDGINIDNTILYENDFTLEQSISSGDTIRFGGCESGCVKFRIRTGTVPPMEGKEIHVKMYIDGDKDNVLSIGKFRVDSDQYTDGRLYRDIVAYDLLREQLNKDMTDWYNGLNLPMTQAQVRASFFSKLGMGFYTMNLPNDSQMVNKKEVASLTARDYLQDYCEVNGVFGFMDNDGRFRFKRLNDLIWVDVELKNVISAQYEDIFSQKILRVDFSDGDNKGSYVIESTGNTYTINNNLLLTGKTNAELNTMAQNFYNYVKDVRYKVVNHVTVKGNPCYECGDVIAFKSGDQLISTYILERRLTGIQALRDEYCARGTQYHPAVDTSSKAVQKQAEYKTMRVKWVSDASKVGKDPYTFYCIAK